MQVSHPLAAPSAASLLANLNEFFFFLCASKSEIGIADRPEKKERKQLAALSLMRIRRCFLCRKHECGVLISWVLSEASLRRRQGAA
jgi:hypothetical protein